MCKLNWSIRACGVLLLWAAPAIALPAQTFTTLHNFDGTDGTTPSTALTQATNGDLYGTTPSGGANGYGTVFKITPTGTLTTLHVFDGTDGGGPHAGLVQGTNGDFYGTTQVGGANGYGTVFKITPTGTLTTLHVFDGTGGGGPYAGLVQGTNGDFYGTTQVGGAIGYGTVFKITPGGALTTLQSFDLADGADANGLIQATNGDLYGTTESGGANSFGTVFKITPSGVLTTLHSFDNTPDGSEPYAVLVQATNGSFYGTTAEGGAHGEGTVFKITPSGALTSLYSFCSQGGSNCTDGQAPEAALIQATNGDLYGTTYFGGANNPADCGGTCGTVFKITISGTLTTLHSFCAQPNCTDGASPAGGLFQATNGTFYGTTSIGGNASTCDPPLGCGTIFSLSVGLGPFVKTLPISGNVGASVKILGTQLTGATSVTFNGTPATFTVIANSEISTTVPTGATTGTVQVVTPTSGTLSSNLPFTVN
jgi:uncharacterized repeat protein (TIGR03803 family)